MSLKARIRGLEAKVEWLQVRGELRLIEIIIKTEAAKRRLADAKAAQAKADAQVAARAAEDAALAARIASAPPPRPRPPPEPVKEIASPAGRCADSVSVTPTISPSRDRVPLRPCGPPPPTEEEIARALWREHKEIAPVRWRFRTLQDDLDDDAEDDNYRQENSSPWEEDYYRLVHGV